MKNIIKTAICLIVISSILLYSSISHAANTVNLSAYIDSATFSFTLIDSVVASSEDNININKYTYMAILHPQLYAYLTDGYLNGICSTQLDFSFSYPTNYIQSGINYEFQGSNNEYINSDFWTSASNSVTIRFMTYFNNLWCGDAFVHDIGELKIYITLSCTDNININSSFLGTCNISIFTNYTDFSANPVTGQGQALIYKQAITDALHNGELDLVYDYLVLWKTTQDGYLADIELSIDDVETWLSYINSAQASLQNKVDLIYVLEQTFPGYFNSMISLLQQIRDMNASDTAAESQMQNAEQQLSQAVNDMEVQKPNINNVVNAGDQYMDSNITGAQGDTFFWLHGTNIFVTILTMAVTIGILGFVIYGKSG